MKNYRLKLAYDGRRYKGWKRDKRDSADKSIQGKLEMILKKLYQKDVEVIGAVNTDAGVHALGQVAHFKTPSNDLSSKEILDYLNEFLPDDIVATSIETVDDRFHSRLNIKRATYEYRLWKVDAKDFLLFERHQVYPMKEALNVEAMKIGATKLTGTHDFSAFTNRSKNKNATKDLQEITVVETDNEVRIVMSARNYLVNMERFIVGTLIQIGTGQRKVNTIDKAFATLDKEYVGHKAMSHSLCLIKVDY